MGRKAVNLVHILLGITLLIAAFSKLIVWSQGRPLLDSVDPLIGQSYRYIYPPVAFVEMFVGFAAIMVSRVSFTTRALLLSWLGCCFVFYRLLAYSIGYKGPCRCLGEIFEWWPFFSQHQDAVLSLLVSIMVAHVFAIVYLLRYSYINTKTKRFLAISSGNGGGLTPTG